MRVAIKDALNRYTPAVPEECYKVSCTIIIRTHSYVYMYMYNMFCLCTLGTNLHVQWVIALVVSVN